MARSCACRRYGVRIESINVVSAVPASRELQDSLAQGAVAAAEAQKFATVARGKANASLIDAEAQARQTPLPVVLFGDSSAQCVRVHTHFPNGPRIAQLNTARGTRIARGYTISTEAIVIIILYIAQARAVKIIASGEADAERIRALGAKEAADTISASEVTAAPRPPIHEWHCIVLHSRNSAPSGRDMYSTV